MLRPALATLRMFDAMFDTMPVRLRKFLGAIALFVLVSVWALLAMAMAQFPAIRDSAVLSILYYVIAGLGWIVPAMPLVSWMGAAPPHSENRKP